MDRRLYLGSRYFIEFVRRQCLNCKVLHLDRLNYSSPYILACTHISHLEPFLLSSMIKHPVSWIARTEMFQFRPVSWFLYHLGAISIRRNYPSINAIRRSIQTLRNGRVVGIFPEGEVKRQKDAIFRGGHFKHGIFTIAQRANVPIIPVVILGTECLNGVEPWYPGSRYPLWVGAGEIVYPSPDYANSSIIMKRKIRAQQAEKLSRHFADIYTKMLQTFKLSDHDIP